MRLPTYSCKNEPVTAAKDQSALRSEALSKLRGQPCSISLMPSCKRGKPVSERRQSSASTGCGSTRVCEVAQHLSETQRIWLNWDLLPLLPRTIRATHIISVNG